MAILKLFLILRYKIVYAACFYWLAKYSGLEKVAGPYPSYTSCYSFSDSFPANFTRIKEAEIRIYDRDSGDA
jgi:hypothetical protein